MYAETELRSLQEFLRQTAEGNLKKMMVGGPMTETHLRILLKVARAGSPDEFVGWAQGEGFPKVKFSAPEQALRETFWPVALDACDRLGLIVKVHAAA